MGKLHHVRPGLLPKRLGDEREINQIGRPDRRQGGQLPLQIQAHDLAIGCGVDDLKTHVEIRPDRRPGPRAGNRSEQKDPHPLLRLAHGEVPEMLPDFPGNKNQPPPRTGWGMDGCKGRPRHEFRLYGP